MYEAFHDRAAFLILSHSYLGVLIEGLTEMSKRQMLRPGCLENRKGTEKALVHIYIHLVWK